MIRAENISKSYGTKIIFHGLSFSVAKGELLTIAGPSGCGKTTVLNIISGLLRPDSGSIINGSKRTGYAFQKDILIPWKSALENVLYVMKNTHPHRVAMEKAVYILKKLGLEDDLNKKPSMMSGGIKKRVNIARAICVDPDILLLDEPFAFLDQKNIEEIISIVSDLVEAGKCSVILVNHDNKYADALPGKVIEITPADNK